MNGTVNMKNVKKNYIYKNIPQTFAVNKQCTSFCLWVNIFNLIHLHESSNELQWLKMKEQLSS